MKRLKGAVASYIRPESDCNTFAAQRFHRWLTNTELPHEASHAASPAAQQQRSRSMRSTSRKPANRNIVAVYAALAPVPATVVLRRQPSFLASYGQWASERQRLATGSLSARLRPTPSIFGFLLHKCTRNENNAQSSSQTSWQ